MQRYRIAVGRSHHVKPGDIVGALANEAGIASRHIGHIKLFDDFSTVDLPKTLAKETLRQLKTVRVRNQVMDIRVDEGPGGESFAPRRKNDKKFDRKPKKAGKAAATKEARRETVARYGNTCSHQEVSWKCLADSLKLLTDSLKLGDPTS